MCAAVGDRHTKQALGAAPMLRHAVIGLGLRDAMGCHVCLDVLACALIISGLVFVFSASFS